MVEFLLSFLKRNKLQTKINQLKYENEKYYGIHFIKIDDHGKEIFKTDPIILQFKKRPSQSVFVKEIIDAFLSNDFEGNFKASMVSLIGEREFGKFLEIVYDEDWHSTIIKPRQNKFIVRVKQHKGIMNTYYCTTFSEITGYLSVRNIQFITIESALIKDLSFLQGTYNHLQKIKFAKCKIASLVGFPKNIINEVSFNVCSIKSFTGKNRANIKKVIFNACYINVSKNDRFLTTISEIETSARKMKRLDNCFPPKILTEIVLAV